MSLGRAFLFLADLEGSLDGGRWIPIGSVVINGGGVMLSGPVTQYFPGLSPAPHRIDVRATCRLLNVAAFSGQELKEVFDNSSSAEAVFAIGRHENPWPALRKPDKWLFTETRSVGVSSITLFKEEFPEDFPHKVFQISDKPIDSSFHPNRIRIFRLNLPQNPSSGIRFIWPADHNEPYCLARNEVSSARIFGVELFGPMDYKQLEVPLAADARLYDDRVAEPLLSFPLALIGPRGVGNEWFQPAGESETGDNWARLRFSPGSVVSSPDVVRRSDGKGIPGHLTLI